MIGNIVEFKIYPNGEASHMYKIYIGKCIDAYTDISGIIRGYTDVFLGFGGGSTKGDITSNRIYKIQYNKNEGQPEKKHSFIDIPHTDIIKIISFAGETKQEENEEKIKGVDNNETSTCN